jgi:hypothetical protein
MFVAPLLKQCSMAILISNRSLGKPQPLSRLRIQKVTIDRGSLFRLRRLPFPPSALHRYRSIIHIML